MDHSEMRMMVTIDCSMVYGSDAEKVVPLVPVMTPVSYTVSTLSSAQSAMLSVKGKVTPVMRSSI